MQLLLNEEYRVGSAGEESASNAGDTGDSSWIPRLGRSPGGGNGNPLQYSYLENPRPGRLQSMGLQRVGHDWETEHTPHNFRVLELYPLFQLLWHYIIMKSIWNIHKNLYSIMSSTGKKIFNTILVFVRHKWLYYDISKFHKTKV